MIQYIKFATLDPVGFILVRSDDIKSIQNTADERVCRLTTPHDQVLVVGPMTYFLEEFRTLFGGEWPAVPSEESNE